ncbi:hypothetical protein A8990_13337 [Paenibacillus taihuensis]|uniref:Uncharacterized protein n=1 Tax=Paenibacillus taihuensis TaxID=1156355 RepID=A0A3D9QXP6_9BACL|nr:hypothetical protein A8990_13337 [Paenibacillus taihuensis]
MLAATVLANSTYERGFFLSQSDDTPLSRDERGFSRFQTTNHRSNYPIRPAREAFPSLSPTCPHFRAMREAFPAFRPLITALTTHFALRERLFPLSARLAPTFALRERVFPLSTFYMGEEACSKLQVTWGTTLRDPLWLTHPPFRTILPLRVRIWLSQHSKLTSYSQLRRREIHFSSLTHHSAHF